ncbi:hypothetical protein FIV42_00565 [Persicimonas caeni]|uniref:HNH nuclease domain-containing protein n=1 Tax=Persicimonas caeni TaxID=2292766 RepID=A0A4Y6PMM4_PERCE|nr:HNH endonuclease [Persicimonas caeni]QDG49277.1 hypothetical protein FIV42_00565 [Persicimonas caeni]QED30498.1 hypothetical protein FRD00_00560 [Persicimonas caeni]
MNDLSRSTLPKTLAAKLQPGEQVRHVPGFEGIYYITSEGRLWSTHRSQWVGTGTDGHGYPQVTLRHDGRKARARVHEIVMEAFVGPRPDDQIVLHANDNPADNRLENLEYGTRGDNLRDAYRNRRRGKLTQSVVSTMRCLRRARGYSVNQLARAAGVDSSTMSRALRGKTWGGE